MSDNFPPPKIINLFCEETFDDKMLEKMLEENDPCQHREFHAKKVHEYFQKATQLDAAKTAWIILKQEAAKEGITHKQAIIRWFRVLKNEAVASNIDIGQALINWYLRQQKNT